LADLIAAQGREIAELTQAATLWQVRAHDLEERLKQLGSGLDDQPELIGDQRQAAPERAHDDPGSTEGVESTHPPSWPARAWRRVRGG